MDIVMKERVELLIEKQSLTPTRFADMISLNRSALSHILSGRNKPSLDVVTKILQCFPNLNSDWLLFGKEPMYLSDAGAETPASLPAATHNPSSLFDSPVVTQEPSGIKRSASVSTPVSERKIARIMIFYTDNTFETIIPDKSIPEF